MLPCAVFNGGARQCVAPSLRRQQARARDAGGKDTLPQGCAVLRVYRIPRTRSLRAYTGEENRKRRVATAASSLTVSAPTAEERFIIHDLFMKSKKNSSCTYTGIQLGQSLVS